MKRSCFFAVTLALALAAFAQAAAPPTREASIRATLESINAQVKAHGGSWDAWAAELKDFRANIDEVRKQKWPWPAKDNYTFNGRDAEVLLRDNLAEGEEGKNPLLGLEKTNAQLKARGIDLIVMIIPDKLSIYPEYVAEKTPADRNVALSVLRFQQQLLEKNIEVIDLQTAFREHRLKAGDAKPLYYSQDTHWRNRGAIFAAELAAERLKRYDFVQANLTKENPYTTKPFTREDGKKADEVIHVLNRDGSFYDDNQFSPVILTADSHGLYNMGKGTVAGQLARFIRGPVTLLSREGLAGDLPVELAKLDAEKQYLKGRRVLVCCFVARMLHVGKWPVVDLGGGQAVEAVAQGTATGTITVLSAPPQKNPPYKQYLRTLIMSGLTDEKGAALGEAAVLVLALDDGKPLPAATLARDQKVTLKLVPFKEVEKRFGQTHRETLAEELTRPLYYGELIEGK